MRQEIGGHSALDALALPDFSADFGVADDVEQGNHLSQAAEETALSLGLGGLTGGVTRHEVGDHTHAKVVETTE